MTTPVTFFVVHEKTVFIPLRFVYPECAKLIATHDGMYPLKCLQEDGCSANMSCMDYLVPRVNYIFNEVCDSSVQMMVAYYKYPDRPNSIRAAIFHRDLREPSIMTLNPWGFRKFQREGKIFSWTPTSDYLNLGAHRGIIPVSNLIK